MKHPAICILVCAVSVILLTGCDQSGSHLVGAWSSYGEFDYGKQRCEFFKDRTCFLEVGGQRLAGTWSALDDGRLKVTVTFGGGPGVTMFATVKGSELSLDEGGNRQTPYVRESSQRAADIQAGIKKAVSEREIRIEAERRAYAEKVAAQEREDARRREAERIEQARREEANRIAREKEQEAQRALQAGIEALKRDLYKEAVAEFERAWQFGNPWGLNNLAWVLATCKDSTQHDGKRAVELALQATKATPANAYFLGTLAAAYARNGQFDQAVSAQVRALSIESIRGAEERLKLYRQGKPYQEQ